MNWKYYAFWSAVGFFSINLIACGGQFKEAQKGRPAAPAKIGPVRDGTGPKPEQGAAADSNINGKPINLELSNISRSVVQTLESADEYIYNFEIKVNGKTYNKSIANLDTSKDGLGSNYQSIEGWHVYWLAKCYEETNCKTVTFTAFLTDSNSQKWLQVAIMKDIEYDYVYSTLAYPETKDAIVTPAVLTIDEVEAKLKSAVSVYFY